MQTLILVVELLRPTKQQEAMYQLMPERNTAFANWLLDYDSIEKATSKTYKLFSGKKLLSTVCCETARTVKSQKNKQRTKKFGMSGTAQQSKATRRIGEQTLQGIPSDIR